ncbi:RNA polymerase sigma factor [Streptomyces sp. NPDC054834]
MEKNVTVESTGSGSIPAPRRRKFPGLCQALAGKRERTEAEAKAEILHRLHTGSRQWYAILRWKLPERYVEDVFGQVTVDLAERLEKIDARTIVNVDAYIWRVCRNAATDQLRRAAAEAVALVRLAALPQPAVDHSDEVLADERKMITLGFLSEVLTERQAVAYTLRYYDGGLSGPEIAEALGISHASVRKDLSVAQKAVEEALNDPEVNQRLRSLLEDGR